MAEHSTSLPHSSGVVPESAKAPDKNSRVRMGMMLGALVMFAALMGGWFWTAFVLAFMWVGFRELRQIMAASGLRPSPTIVMVTNLLMVLVATLGHAALLPPLLTMAIIASFFRLLLLQPRVSVGDVGATLVAIFYIGYLPIHYVLLRQLQSDGIENPLVQPGVFYMLMIIFIISLSDIGAYYVGKKFGRHLLYPEISPKKTREGAVGGLLTGVLTGAVFAWIIRFPLWHAVVLGVILVIVGQLGDLTESMLKRDAGLKDSGELLKGHGGILDRADSYIFSGAICYYYIHWVILNQGLAEDFLRWLHRIG